MTKFGQVSAYNAQTGMATVTYARPDACEKCGACGTKTHMSSIDLKADCALGDWVRVELPDNRFMQATALAYLLPLCAFLLGLGLGYVLSGQQEIWALLGSLLGLALAMLALKRYDRHISGKPEWLPHIVEIYSTKPDMSEIGCDLQSKP
ncbi:MAG: SoxR reducing system RseC family protein [Clostridia bacterium]